jgi:hypothetical protein
VFVCHCAEFWFPSFFLPLAHIAHGAVIIFFVISGYVMASSTFSNEFIYECSFPVRSISPAFEPSAKLLRYRSEYLEVCF